MLTLFLGSTPPDVCLQIKQFWVMGMFRLMSVYKATSGQGNVLPDVCLQTKQFLVKAMFHLMTVYEATSGQGNVPPGICLQSDFGSWKCSTCLFTNNFPSVHKQKGSWLGCNQLSQLVTTGEHAGRQLLLGVRY